MVRRPPPVLTPPPRRRPGPGLVALGVPLVALAYFLAAPALPALPAGDTTVLVAGGIGLLMVAATTLSLLPARDTVVGPLLIVLGAGLLAGALNAAGVGAGANVAEAMLAAAVGLLFARCLRPPRRSRSPCRCSSRRSTSGRSPAARPRGCWPSDAETADPLSFDLPAWGDEGSAGHLGVSDAVFLSMFAAGRALRLSPRARRSPGLRSA